MTVHGQWSSAQNKMKMLPSNQNGYMNSAAYPQDSQLSVSRSWNGLVFQVSPIRNGYTNGHTMVSPLVCQENGSDSPRSGMSTPDKMLDSPFVPVSKPRFSIGSDDVEEASYYSQFDYLEPEQEYVTLDNNYLVTTTSTPAYTRHLSMLDFKRNQLNNSTRSDKSRQVPFSAHNQVFIDKNLDQSYSKQKSLKRKSLKKIAENIGSVLSLSPRKDGNPKLFSPREETVCVKRERSKSVGDLEMFEDLMGQRTVGQEGGDGEGLGHYSDDDVDGDDYGFLSYPFSSSSYLSVAMNKTKSPTPSHRILPRIRRSKTKPLPGAQHACMWSSQGHCTWTSLSGRRVELRPFCLLQITDAERHVLHKIALSRLQALNLGCPIVIPKESTDCRRPKRQILSFKRSKSANLASIIDKVKSDGDNKEHQPVGLVFGIPLAKCIANDIDLQKKRSAKNENNDVIIHRREPRKSSSSSQGSTDNLNQNGNTLSPASISKRVPSTDSLSESDCSRHTTNSSLVDALSLSTRPESLKNDQLSSYPSSQPRVPKIVQTCFKYLEAYGLQVLGIFRVGASKKRVKQLRDEFDSGKDVNLDESQNCHDVGALLKEYFRDLPEALLTRDLYSAFVATRKLPSKEARLEALSYLVSLLPVSNRDTLWALLNFLSTVDQHSMDKVGEDGQTLPGNKMDSNNLATLFGPNILHKVKASEKEYQVESLERAEERKDVIDVIKDMIENYNQIFQVRPEVHDEVIKLLVETDPETADDLLKAMSNDMGIEPDPDTTSSSIFEDSDTASLPRSPCSEGDFNASATRDSALHPPLRNTHSEDIMTPKTRRRFFFSSSDSDKSKNKTDNNNTEKERPKFRLRMDRSPSPGNRTKMRPPKVKISSDSSSPEISVRRSRSEYVDRPRSENYSNSLAIPKPNYVRQNSATSFGSYANTSSSDSVPDPEVSGQYLLPTPVSTDNSPLSKRISPSQRRPLGVRRNAYSGWERERWRQWEMLAAEGGDEGFEKETLV
ncbi:uncharacterized protein LOC134259513 [Saccostrea cucullata]|uniref:uncharacterized protein LOC134259513 n=1 Tax=Saccostrea cuccullata TaxID=36930 RepID=UPI002ED5FF6D